MEATSEFAQARITTYVPIFIRRQVHEKLVLMRNAEETTIIDTSSTYPQWSTLTVEIVTHQRQVDLAKDL
jgi:hypothetical protein